MCCSGSVTDSLTFISRLRVHHSSIELSHGKWASTCGVTSHLNFAPDWNWDKFARIAYTGSTRYCFISFSGFFRTGINVLKPMPISFWWLVWGLCLWTTTNYVKNYLNFILLSFGKEKKNMFLILKWVLSVVQLDILVQKRSQTKNYLLFLRSSWYLTVVQQSKKSFPKMSLTDSKFWKMNSSFKSNKTKHSQLLSQFQNKIVWW